jgi:hypothetical protein
MRTGLDTGAERTSPSPGDIYLVRFSGGLPSEALPINWEKKISLPDGSPIIGPYPTRRVTV